MFFTILNSENEIFFTLQNITNNSGMCCQNNNKAKNLDGLKVNMKCEMQSFNGPTLY